MPINIRSKGQSGEREVADQLNLIILTVLKELDIPIPEKAIIQRNQNQSAVGGSDLSNTFGLAIEIKRHETLSINTWWRQCVTSAERNNEIPVLIFRQNRKAWRVVMNGWININSSKQVGIRSEFSWDEFQYWFYLYAKDQLENGAKITV